MAGNTPLVLLLLICSLTVTVTVSVTETPLSAEDWLKTTPLKMGKEKVTHMHFFLHELANGENATIVTVAQAASSNESATSFGSLFMIDDELREGPEPTSKLIGRAQGLDGSAGQKAWTLIMAFSFVFTDGQYNGSSLSTLGRNPINEPVRELPIVGGTGSFQFARGFAVTKTHSLNATSGVVIAEYNLTVIHY